MPVIYPIGGGKGGVGKSFITASLGAFLAMRGNRVALVDLDLGGANLHTILGGKIPGKGLGNYIDKNVDRLSRIALPTHIAGLSLISSCRCSIEIANLYYAQKTKLINAIKNLPFDYVFLDLGAGTNFNTIDFFNTSDFGIVVCTPEPTSIENTFRFINAVYLRRLKQTIRQGPFDEGVKKAVLQKCKKELTCLDIFKIVDQQSHDKLDTLKEILSNSKFSIIVNQYRKNTDPTLGLKLETVCNRHFYSPFVFVGRVGFDERVHDAVYQKKLFVELYPNTTTSVDIKHIIRELARNNADAIGKGCRHENVG